MERLKALNRCQKGIMIAMVAMILVFSVLYPRTLSKYGYIYHDVILVPGQENGATLYAGRIRGESAVFSVSDDQTLTFQYGDKTYGPYSVKEDPTALPIDSEIRNGLTGIEILEGDQVMFRGGVMDGGDCYWLWSQDGSLDSVLGITAGFSDGTEVDAEGNPVDGMKPTATNIYELLNNPSLTHKGFGGAWFAGVFLCLVNACSILFADEIFRFNLSFRIRGAEYVEPSEWEIMARYIGWFAIPVLTLVLFIVGLQ